MLPSPARLKNELNGVLVYSLQTHRDDRGNFTEAFRSEWGVGIDPVQWNVVTSEKGTLRGVHVHPRHTDLLVVVMGHATIGLHDLRANSVTEGRSTTVDLSGDNMSALVIPPGVAHGFLFHKLSLTVYAVSEYWDTSDELAVHWADPGLGINWPFSPTRVSARDASAGTLAEVVAELSPHQPI